MLYDSAIVPDCALCHTRLVDVYALSMGCAFIFHILFLQSCFVTCAIDCLPNFENVSLPIFRIHRSVCVCVCQGRSVVTRMCKINNMLTVFPYMRPVDTGELVFPHSEELVILNSCDITF